MNNQVAIVLGTAIIAAAIVGSQFIGRYEIATGTSGVWRVDKRTGEVQFCSPLRVNAVISPTDELEKLAKSNDPNDPFAAIAKTGGQQLEIKCRNSFGIPQ
jgi:hypothetical protein